MLRDTSNAGRETVAKQNISKNERILEVPYDIILSDETFDRLNLIPNIPDTISFTNKIVFLLLYYKKNNINMEYINTLPKDFNFLPYNWSGNKIELIKNTTIFQELSDNKDHKEREYEVIKTYSQNLIDFTEEEYFWARACVNTRNYSTFRQNNNISTMVPFADMINHSYENNAHWEFDNEKDLFVVKADKNISAGEPVTESYGELSATRCLIWYGFFPAERHTIDIDGVNLTTERND